MFVRDRNGLEPYIDSWLSIQANPIKPPCSLVQLSVFAVNKSVRIVADQTREALLGQYVARLWAGTIRGWDGTERGRMAGERRSQLLFVSVCCGIFSIIISFPKKCNSNNKRS